MSPDDTKPMIIAKGYDPFRAAFTAIHNTLLDAPSANYFKHPSCKYVLIMILRWYNNDEAKAWPSQQRLAEMTGLSISTIKRVINELETSQYLYVERPGNNQNNIYHLTHKIFEFAQPEPKQTTAPTHQTTTPSQQKQTPPPQTTKTPSKPKQTYPNKDTNATQTQHQRMGPTRNTPQTTRQNQQTIQTNSTPQRKTDTETRPTPKLHTGHDHQWTKPPPGQAHHLANQARQAAGLPAPNAPYPTTTNTNTSTAHTTDTAPSTTTSQPNDYTATTATATQTADAKPTHNAPNADSQHNTATANTHQQAA